MGIIMNKYWFLHIKDNNNRMIGIAKSPGNKTLVDWTNDITSLKRIPFSFSVNRNKHLEDYLSDDLGIPLMSKKLKDVIDKHLSGNENLIWYDAIINYGNEKIIYYAPKFESNLDVLKYEKSLFNKSTGSLIKANLSILKL